MHRSLLTILAFLAAASPALANNSYFIPGDAFFYFEIDQKEWGKFQNGELTELDYDRPKHLSFTFCGYAGCQKLDISGISDKTHADLVAAISEMKKEYPTKIVVQKDDQPQLLIGPQPGDKIELNKIRVFVYNRSFDIEKYRLGLKYNESWPDVAVELGHTKKHFQFDFFVTSAHGIAESWRWGSAVEPFTTSLPPIERSFTKTPIKVDPAKTMFIVAPPISFEALCFPPRQASTKLFVVTEEGRKTFVVDESRRDVWTLQK